MFLRILTNSSWTVGLDRPVGAIRFQNTIIVQGKCEYPLPAEFTTI
jgi:hypothetical protein